MRKLLALALTVLFASVAQAQVHGETRTICVTPTITDTYAIKDAIGATHTLANAFSGSHSGIVQSVVLTDVGDEEKQVEICFLKQTLATEPTDSAAFDLVDADLSKIAGCLTIADFSSFNDNGIGQATSAGLPVVSTDTSLRFLLIAREAQTLAASALKVCVSIIED